MKISNLKPATASTPTNHWPTLRHFMDQALEAPRGIRLHHLNNVTLTAGRASDIRNIMGKIRKADQRKNQDGIDPTDPTYGQSPYNALTFIVVPSLANATINVDWLWPQTDLPWQTWLNLNSEHLPAEARQLAAACNIVVETAGQRFAIKSAPSFAAGWRLIRTRLPAYLDILNTYSIVANTDFEILPATDAQTSNNPLSPGIDQ